LFELAVAKIIPALAGIVFVFVAANYFSPEAYGRFAIVFATSNLLVVISSVWIAQSVMRFTGGRFGEKSMGAVVLIALAIAAILGFATSVFSALSHRPIEGVEISLAFGLVALTLALSLNTTTSAYAIALQRYRVYRIAEVGRALLLVISVSVVAALNMGIAGLVLSYALATAIPSVILLFYLRNDAAKLPAAHSLKEVLAKYMQYGWPMTLWAGLQATQSVMERSVLSLALSDIDFGHFMAANDVVVRGIGLMLMPIVTLLHSQLMASSGHGVQLDEKSKKLLTSGIFLVLLGGAILAGAILVGRDLVGFIAPGIRRLDLFTIFMMCISAVAWALALITHKPLELRKSTLLMSVLLGAAIGLQWVLLNLWVGSWAELAMPLASFCAALAYMFACLVSAERSQ
jgi:O-antigen/teichoic acid export membrane protein